MCPGSQNIRIARDLRCQWSSSLSYWSIYIYHKLILEDTCWQLLILLMSEGHSMKTAKSRIGGWAITCASSYLLHFLLILDIHILCWTSWGFHQGGATWVLIVFPFPYLSSCRWINCVLVFHRLADLNHVNMYSILDVFKIGINAFWPFARWISRCFCPPAPRPSPHTSWDSVPC